MAVKSIANTNMEQTMTKEKARQVLSQKSTTELLQAYRATQAIEDNILDAEPHRIGFYHRGIVRNVLQEHSGRFDIQFFPNGLKLSSLKDLIQQGDECIIA